MKKFMGTLKGCLEYEQLENWQLENELLEIGNLKLGT
jgi:hypothetical protein